MSDLISRKQALISLNDALLTWSHMAEWRDNKIRKAIADLPSAQQEIIQCRECKHSAMIYSTNMVPVVGGFEADGIDHIFCQCNKLGGIEMRWDDFCSRAERESEE